MGRSDGDGSGVILTMVSAIDLYMHTYTRGDTCRRSTLLMISPPERSDYESIISDSEISLRRKEMRIVWTSTVVASKSLRFSNRNSDD